MKFMNDLELVSEQNLPPPNITTNDVNYRHQLHFISFNPGSSSIFYTYDERIARKGSVAPILTLQAIRWWFCVILLTLTQLQRKRNKHSTLDHSYHGLIPITKAKFDDLLNLKQVLANPAAQGFYDGLADEFQIEGD
ncbi:hypothetical protein HHI36_007141 [Cryptolaemus montrouzieri]|uniref:Uncharacterized protein n=1 Tax=Cryptolaemus montrouzieri TaxID=559131 RepID=A0ABD2MNM2_9CUCU